MNGIHKLQTLPTEMQIILVILALVQIALIISALIVLARADGPIKGVPRGIWLIVILLGQLLGAPLFLILAHLDKKAQNERARNELAATAPSGKAKSTGNNQNAAVATAINHLYGDKS